MEAPSFAAHFVSVLENSWYEFGPNPAVCSCCTDGFIFPAVPSILLSFFLYQQIRYFRSHAPPNRV